jgi:glycolate oxidase FAD binding subunit
MAVRPADGEQPQSEADLARIVRDAAAPLSVEGNNTKQGMLRPVQAASVISTRNLVGITLHAPKELVIAASAGTPLSDFEAAVEAEGQQIIAEPPDYSAIFGSEGKQTLGGVVATNLSGPRRVAWGAIRDHVIGVRAVNGRGEIIRSGGRVLKNVTGLDLCKLLTGSHGTLAVLTEITMKVLPKPERQATLMWQNLDPVRGVAVLAEALGSPFAVSGAAYIPAPSTTHIAGLEERNGSVALARLEDFASFIPTRADKLRASLAAFGRAELIEDAENRAMWRCIRDAAPMAAKPEAAVWRVSVRPSAGPAVAAAVEAVGATWFMDWGGGLVWVSGPANEITHHAVCEAALAAKGTWMLFRAPPTMRAAVEVVPPEAPPLARITRDVKAAFDPRGILNPGRIFAGV